MAKFELAADKMIIVGGVCVSFKSGVNETTNEEVIEALRKAKGVTEIRTVTVKKRTKKADAQS